MQAFVVFILAILARDTIATPIIAVGETGASAQFRSEDNLGNYNFGYNEDHTSGGTFRREAGDAHGNVAGSYGLRDADGRIRIVNYVANDDGFKADIQTNEPGVEPKDTADATFNKAESVVVETVAAPAPVVASPAPFVPAPAPFVAVPAAEPIAYQTEPVAVAAPVFPPVSSIPIAKTIAQPVAYTFPEPAAIPVAKTIATPVAAVAEPAPLTYAFPAPAAVPIAKSASTTIVTEAKPISYFPAPAAIPVAKSSTTTVVTEAKPITYTFPEPAPVPIAKTIAAPVAVAPGPYAFPAPAAIPVAKSSSLHYAAQPIATAPLAYAAAPASKFSYATEVRVHNAPTAVAYSPVLRYTINPHLTAFRYATPYYKSLYSPAVASFAGAIPYFNHIQYNGFPYVKK